MVATLIKLRWLLTFNNIKGKPWAIIAWIIAALYAVGAMVALVGGAVGLGHAAPHNAAAVITIAGAVMIIGWAVVPLSFSGVDSTFDPRAFVTWVAPSRSLAWATLAAGMAGLPGLVAALVGLLPVLIWVVAGQWAAAVAGLLVAPFFLIHCVALSRIVVIGAASMSRRVWRESFNLLGFALIIMAAMAPSVFVNLGLVNNRMVWDVITGEVTTVLQYTPMGWAASVSGYVAQGQWVAALISFLAAAALSYVLVIGWERVLARVMFSPEAASGRGGAYTSRASLAALSLYDRLSRVLPGPAAATAVRCLRYWRRDPRYSLSAVSMLLVPVMMTLGMLSGAMGAHDGSVSDLLAHPPSIVLVIVPLMGYMTSWLIANDLSMDSTALWMGMSAGVRGRDDRLGRVASLLCIVLPVLIVVGIAVGLWAGELARVPAFLGTALALFSAGAAWSSVISVVVFYEVVPPGGSMWRTSSSGRTLVSSLIQMVALVIVPILAAPAIVALIVIMAADAWGFGWLLLAGGTAWGALLIFIGVRWGGSLYDARVTRVLSTVRTWQGHSL